MRAEASVDTNWSDRKSNGTAHKRIGSARTFARRAASVAIETHPFTKLSINKSIYFALPPSQQAFSPRLID